MSSKFAKKPLKQRKWSKVNHRRRHGINCGYAKCEDQRTKRGSWVGWASSSPPAEGSGERCSPPVGSAPENVEFDAFGDLKIASKYCNGIKQSAMFIDCSNFMSISKSRVCLAYDTSHQHTQWRCLWSQHTEKRYGEGVEIFDDSVLKWSILVHISGILTYVF